MSTSPQRSVEYRTTRVLSGVMTGPYSDDETDNKIVRSVMDLGLQEVHDTPGLLQVRNVGEQDWRDVDSSDGAAGPVRRVRPELSEKQVVAVREHCQGIDGTAVEYGAPLASVKWLNS